MSSVDADLSDGQVVEAVVSNAGGVVNCVAGSPQLIVSVGKNLIKAVGRMPVPPRVVHISSLAAYGSATGLVNEQRSLDGNLGAYSAAKAQTDRLAATWCNAAILRPGIVYGPGSSWWSDRIARLLIRGRLGDLGELGRGCCNLVYVDDVADAVVRALRLESGQSGAFNLAMPVPITWNDYFVRYAAALGAPERVQMSAARIGAETRVFAPALKLWELLLASPALARWNPLPPLRPWLPVMCRHDIRMDVTRAEQILGMQWVSLSDGLRASADWFLSGGRTVR